MGRIPFHHQFFSLICLVSCCFSPGLAISRRRRDIIDDRSSLLSFKSHLIIPDNNIITRNWSDNTSPCTWVGVTCALRHQRVTALNLSHMALAGTISPHLGNLSFLTSLNLSFNSFYGSLPKQLSHLRRLVYVSLKQNHFANEIPSWLDNFHKLQYLNLRNNSFTGPIPKQIANLSQLNVLVLRGNQLQGSIPSTIFNMSSLSALDLSFNYISGTLPVDLCNHLPLLRYLSVSANQLEGELPSLDIGNLKQLVQLDLSHNQLGGEIPSTIGGAIMLTQLSLAHNNLHGSIPSAISKLISLESLDLSSNNVSGVIPMSMEALKHLSYLNVSINKLHGQIPTGGCFANFTSESFVENDGFCGASRLQVPSCRNATIRRSMSRTVLLVICIIVLLILVCVAILFFKRRQARNFNAPAQTDLVPPSLRKVTYFELVRATDSFSESNLLGSGSFGSVYKGVLLNGMNVAVKVFNMQLERTLKSFNVECEVLRMVRHRNLVGIISSCTNLDFMALVLEYMPCGSLEKWLYSHNYCLDISQRLNIMIDVASALEYLHHGQTTPIVHCDLKPSNVLLDEDMVAHVSDFGISKLFGEDEFVSHTNTLATVGYMAPEYGSEGIVSTKGDVYSYGILLMETFTRKRPTDETFSSEMSLRSWVSSALHDSLLSEVVDTNLLSNEDEQHLPAATKQCVSSIFELALDCSINSHVERIISMANVVVRLEKIKIALYATNTRAPTRIR